jgi:hypothetical protein
LQSPEDPKTDPLGGIHSTVIKTRHIGGEERARQRGAGRDKPASRWIQVKKKREKKKKKREKTT